MSENLELKEKWNISELFRKTKNNNYDCIYSKLKRT